MAFKRKRMNRKRSRKVFSRGAWKVHRKNVQTNPMRGGIRL